LKTEQLRRRELEWKLQQLLGKRFGPSSEKIDPAQLELLMEGLEQDGALDPSEGQSKPPKEKKRSRNKRASFPEEMIERELEFDLPEEGKTCATTGKPLKFIRWEESIKYDFVPGHFERLRIKRAVYASPASETDPLPEQPMVTAPMPAKFGVIPGSMAAAGLLVYILVAKYCDHLPLYRIQNIFKRRHGVEIDRNTMCHWIKRCSEVLGVLYDAVAHEIRSGDYVEFDETFIKLLDPDTKGKAKQCNFWVAKTPGVGVFFRFDPSRGHEVPLEMLGNFEGRLQSDGYPAYQTLLRKRGGLLAFYCWAHVRRKFVESLGVNPKEAAWYIAEIQKLYRVEAEARELNLTHEQRGELRSERSRPVLDGIKTRLDRDLSSSDILPSSPLGKAIRYTLSLWEGLVRYAEKQHGVVEIDNNLTENAIRPTAIGKKNWLFIGHPKAGQRSAIIYTIVENCRMWDINPMEYLLDVMPRVMEHPANRIAELLPRAWKEAREARSDGPC
jgi:transposase